MLRRKTWLGCFGLLAALAVMGQSGGCDTPQDQARQEAENRAASRRAFVPKNGLEFKNYNRRQELADDPTVILWCTSAFPIPSSPLFTVPVVGKLSSGNKRPFPTAECGTSCEQPGADGMYGSSGEYRFGFTPGGVYADWYNMSVFCTTEPTVWQRENTTIVMQTDPGLSAAHEQARDALRRGDTEGANRILEAAIRAAGGAR